MVSTAGLRRVFALGVALVLAGSIGTMAGTSLACGVGLLAGERDYCGVIYFWLLGIPIASLAALVIGLPLHALFVRLRLDRWWHYAGAGAWLGVGTLALSYLTGASWPLSSWLAVTQVMAICLAGTLAYGFLLKYAIGQPSSPVERPEQQDSNA